jgi:hypothetical protein
MSQDWVISVLFLLIEALEENNAKSLKLKESGGAGNSGKVRGSIFLSKHLRHNNSKKTFVCPQ